MPALTIDIEARFAQFQDALEKIDRTTARTFGSMQRHASALDSTFKSLGVAIGTIFSVETVRRTFSAAVDELAALDDAAESTGSSVETISAALNTLRANDAGGLEQISELAGRLGRSLAGVDKDTSKAAEAFKRLGLSIEDLKGAGRVDGILAIAKAQAQFADSGEKAIVIDAALGRGAAQLIPQLNELAKTTADAATATGKQATEAEAARKALASFQAQTIAFRNDLVGKVLPSLNDLLISFRAFYTIGAAPRDLLASLFGDDGDLQRRIEDRRGVVEQLRLEFDRVQQQLAKTPTEDVTKGTRDALSGRLQAINAVIAEEGARINQLRALIEAREALSKRFRGDPASPERPGISAAGLTGGGDDKAAERLQQRQDDAIAAIDRQLLKTRDLTVLEETLFEIQSGRYREFSEGAQARLLFSATLIDSANKEKAAFEGLASAAADAGKRVQESENALFADIQAGGGPAAALAKRAADVLNALPDAVRFDKQELVDHLGAMRDAGAITEDAFARAVDQVLEVGKALDDTAGKGLQLQQTFDSAFERFLFEGGKARDLLAGLLVDFGKLALRQQITTPLYNAVFGSPAKGDGDTLFGGLRKILGFADGGIPPVGRWSLVGERGPELIRPLAPMRVVPNGQFGMGGVSVVQNINVGAGASRNEVMAAAEIAKRQAIREISESMARGGYFAGA